MPEPRWSLVERLLGGPPDKPAVVDETGTALTFGELAQRAAVVRGGLAGQGIGAGDRVGIALGNRPEFVVAYLALLGLGAVAVPLNPESPKPELDENAARARLGLILREPADLPAGPPLGAKPVAVSAPAVLCDTAGTAGRPRSAVLTHANLLAALDQISADPRTRLHEDDVALGVLPLFHIFGLQVVLAASLAAGATVRLRSRFDPEEPLDGITLVSGVPPMFDAWAAAAISFDGVRLIVSGAAPLSARTVVGFESVTGRAISQGYGLTEASPVVTSGLLLDQPDPLSVGMPFPGIEVRLADVEGFDVLQGDPGEILVRGPNVFSGYDGDPEATAFVLADGWLHTGDVGVADEQGRLYLVDRAKDVIIVSGFNVFPGEVEEVLAAHEAVAAVGVVGVADAATGEAVKAVVVRRPGAKAGADELVAWCRARLARYKCPYEVEFVESLPRLPTGKLLRRSL